MYPPRLGPQIGATRVVIDQIAKAVPFLFSGNRVRSSACDPGMIGPETPPCTTRKRISSVMLVERPQRNDMTVNNATDVTKVCTTPNRRINHPVNGTDTPLATAKEVMIQVPWSDETPRLPAMVGIETFAMVVSSTCMNVASASARSVTPRGIPPEEAACGTAASIASERDSQRF